MFALVRPSPRKRPPVLSILFAGALSVGALQNPLPVQQAPQTPQIPDDTEIVTTESGLKYSVLAEGDGSESPRIGDVVRVHYTGWLPDGTMFDSSRQRGMPTEFGLGAVIEGWNEALQLMSPGSRLKLTIPPDLGYGEQGSPPVIPANATLIFDVELIAIPARNPLPFLEWDGEGGTTTESGIAWKELSPGSGGVMDSQMLWLEFAMWTEGGELLFSDLLYGRPLLIPDPKAPQLSLLTELLPSVTMGSTVIARVPVSKMPELQNEKLDPEGHAIWQFRFAAASTLEKPEFVLPPDEELITTESGLKYKVLREGCARTPDLSNTVLAHYAGWLTNGNGFDASYDRGSQPSRFPLGNLIKGWQEGMQLMGRGAKFLFVVPPDLGYGSADKGNIPPNSTLVFVVELIDFG